MVQILRKLKKLQVLKHQLNISGVHQKLYQDGQVLEKLE